MTLDERIAQIIDLGLTNYEDTYKLQQELTKARENNEIPDIILLAEHKPIVNFGMREIHNTFSDYLYNELKKQKKDETQENAIKYLENKDINFSRTSRGGGATYIGPGQLNIYPIVKYEEITGKSFDVNKYKEIIDNLMNDVLRSLYLDVKIAKDVREDDVKAKESNRQDVWLEIEGKKYKLGGKGIHIRKNVAYHGFNFYVKKESVSGFKYVDACGYNHEDLGTISVEDALQKNMNMEEFKNRVLQEIKTKFGYKTMSKIDLHELKYQS